MNDLELKKFAKKNKLDRNEIAELLDSSIHSVNSWFSGSRNIPTSKAKILLSYNTEKPIPTTIEELLIKKVEHQFKGEINELKEMIKSLKEDIQLINTNSMRQRNADAKKSNQDKQSG